jgi:Mrp family chromosome partitioning ATPase
MERIKRALELAYEQREKMQQAAVISQAPPRTVAQSVAEPAAVDFTETVLLRTPVVELDPLVRENERILPPGAGGPYGGAFKMLRTQVLRRMDQLGATTLGVMSGASGDGKTLTAINLAIAIAADPARTAMLVDFDLRNPGIHRRFHYEPEVGVEECLEQRRSVRDAMFKVAGYEGLTVLAAKHRSENSSELLTSPRTAEVVAEMRARYANRILIFDVPPVLQADDALAFMRNLQAGLLVIGERRTRRDDVSRTLELLRDLPFVGTVLNASREPIKNYY